jgi:hypothetical protein
MEGRHGQDGNLHPELIMSYRRNVGTITGMDWGIIIHTLYHLVYPYVTFNDVYVRRLLRGVDVS